MIHLGAVGADVKNQRLAQFGDLRLQSGLVRRLTVRGFRLLEQGGLLLGVTGVLCRVEELLTTLFKGVMQGGLFLGGQGQFLEFAQSLAQVLWRILQRFNGLLQSLEAGLGFLVHPQKFLLKLVDQGEGLFLAGNLGAELKAQVSCLLC